MSNELKYILVRTDGTYSIVEISDEDFLSQLCNLLKCDSVDKFRLIYDEYLFYNPKKGYSKIDSLNFFATFLNQTLHKGHAILGYALIGKMSGCDIIGLSSDSINRYISRLEVHGYVNSCG